MERYLPVTIFLALLALMLAPDARGADQPAQTTPAFGGSGGSPFTLSCGSGYVLTGLRGRSGVWVDRIGVLCRPVRANGTLGAETIRSGEVGGGGGDPKAVSCPSGQVVSGFKMRSGSFVDWIALYCSTWRASDRTWHGRTELSGHSFGMLTPSMTSTFSSALCELAKQPAVAIHGRAGSSVDAVGLKCNEP